MDASTCEKILASGGLDIAWPNEPLLGSYYGEEELEVINRTIRDSMDPTKGFGFICPEIEEFEAALAKYCGTADCVTINGAGAGLDMTLMCLDLSPEDEVIVPSVNFKAAMLAVIGQRAKLVVCEIDPRTLCADVADVEAKLTERTRAIMVTHMNGYSAHIDEYQAIAEARPHPKYGPAKFIGDVARCMGGEYKGRKNTAGAWMSVLSFHTQKLMTTLGEGGGVTVEDPELANRLRGLRQFGWQGGGWGSNYKMTKVQAAVGIVQLRKLDKMIAERRAVAIARTELLKDVPELTLPYENDLVKHTYYLYTILVPEDWASAKRDQLMRMLWEDYQVSSVVANPPCHTTVPFIAEHTQGQNLPKSELIAARLFCVPMHPQMSHHDNEYISAAVATATRRIAAGETTYREGEDAQATQAITR
ncbi:MAG: aminotransferase class I/II-fold pyridoxal phosphate-dependent enzyme [Armatimonadia bacterium]